MDFGFEASVKEKCMPLGFATLVCSGSASPSTVHCAGEVAGDIVADLVVEEVVIVELKSVGRNIKAHEVLLTDYLVATKKHRSGSEYWR